MAAGYGEELLGRVSGLVAECTRRVSRATRRLLRRNYHGITGAGQRRRNNKQQHQTTTMTTTASSAAGTVVAAALCARGAAIDKGRASASASSGGEALWSRRILMGERCQPLDFAGAIHYDSFGRRLARPPMPRSASYLSCRSSSGSGRSAAADVDADGSDDASYHPAENDDVDSPSSS